MDMGQMAPQDFSVGNLGGLNPMVAQMLGYDPIEHEPPTVIEDTFRRAPQGGPMPGEKAAPEGASPPDAPADTAPKATQEQPAQPQGVGGLGQTPTEAVQDAVPPGLTNSQIERHQELEAAESAYNQLRENASRGGLVSGIKRLGQIGQAKKNREELAGLKKIQAVRQNYLSNLAEKNEIRRNDAQLKTAEEAVQHQGALEAFTSVRNSFLLGQPIDEQTAQTARLRGSMVDGRWVGPTIMDVTNVSPRVLEHGGMDVLNALQEPLSDEVGLNDVSFKVISKAEDELRDFDNAQRTLAKKESRTNAREEASALRQAQQAMSKMFAAQSSVADLKTKMERFGGTGMVTNAQRQQVELADRVAFVQASLVQQAVDSGRLPGFAPGTFTASDLLTTDKKKQDEFIPRLVNSFSKGIADADSRTRMEKSQIVQSKDKGKPPVVDSGGKTQEQKEREEMRRLMNKKRKKKRP